MLLFVIAVLLTVAGCGGPGNEQANPGPAGESTTGSTTTSAAGATTDPTTANPTAPGVPTPTVTLPLPVPPDPNASQVPAPPSLMDQIKADAAQRTGVSPADVQVIRSTAQTWNDGSLGCPKPGENYIQVMMEGFQVIVQAGGRPLDYRTTQSAIRLCEQY